MTTTTTTRVVREGERERDLDFFVGEEGGRSKEEEEEEETTPVSVLGIWIGLLWGFLAG